VQANQKTDISEPKLSTKKQTNNTAN